MLSEVVLGLMSGSSLDGLDLAMVEFITGDDDVIEWKLLASHEFPFENQWKKRLESATKLSASELLKLDAAIGGLFGKMCAQFIDSSGIKPDYIASHGHTIFHNPEQGYTLQIGSPAHIATLTGIPVISDFRSNDIAHGGQGAPLAPIVEKYLFAGYGYYLNLGGITNLSTHNGEDIQAWDISACNQLLNYLAAQKRMAYDNEGALARTGNISPELLHQLNLVIPLPLKAPYSLDNSFVTDSFIPLLKASSASIEDQLRTIVEYISASVATQIKYISEETASRAIPEDENNSRPNPDGGNLIPSLLATGGGAHNTFLIEEIRNKLIPLDVEVHIPESDIINFKEAILMALCGLLREIESPNALASVTGASENTINGAIYLP
jgi:anhydro-N-acetylmuramic acid kinase